MGEKTTFKNDSVWECFGKHRLGFTVWQKQIEWKNAINLTDGDASRYFFTLQEVFKLTDFILESESSGQFSFPKMNREFRLIHLQILSCIIILPIYFKNRIKARGKEAGTTYC
ncbi:hypothetical protein [Zunongwangia endophytica]|uniref:hypothetical protein n=1 Tax=Zunongwangia endophytica TaxID=1808945 RepID=UPI00338F4224